MLLALTTWDTGLQQRSVTSHQQPQPGLPYISALLSPHLDHFPRRRAPTDILSVDSSLATSPSIQVSFSPVKQNKLPNVASVRLLT